MVKIERVYAPGACNISPQEGAVRLASGFIGTGLTIAAALAFFAFGVAPLWRLTLFLPAVMAATGFLQASLKFCVNYGMRGVYNVANEVGETSQVDDASKAVDRRRALVIIGWASLIGAVVAVGAALVPQLNR
jgi:hypothetical protein